MTVSDQTTALSNALLAACSPAALTQWLDPTDALSPGSGGYTTLGALTALCGIALRQHGPGRGARIVVDTVDLTCTYTITLTDTARGISESVAYNATAGAPADLPALLVQWLAAIQADAGVHALVSSAINADGDGIDLIFRSPIATGVQVTQSSSAALTVTLDYESGTAILYERTAVQVQALTGANLAAATSAVGSWQACSVAGAPMTLALSAGQGWTGVVPCPSSEALAWSVFDLAGHADDGTTGGGVTVGYRTPDGWCAAGIAP